MAVSRRAPVVPQSSQAKSSASSSPKKEVVPATNGPKPSKKAAHEQDHGSSKKGKSGGKHKKSKKSRGKPRDLVDTLTRILITIFTIYVFSVCPTDEKLESQVCKGIANYRRYVLEPYLFPQLQAVAEHPAVKPYVDTARPYVEYVVKTATPILARTQDEFNNRIAPQWNKRVVPQWEKRVVPQWEKRVVPQWEKYASPHIHNVQKQVEPYTSFVEDVYSERLVPQVTTAARTVQRWQRVAQPYIAFAASKTHQGYQFAKPYALPLWRYFLDLVGHVLSFFQDQRRQFVDPHVAQLWDKVKELSGAKPKLVSSSISQSLTQPASQVTGSTSLTSSPLATHSNSEGAIDLDQNAIPSSSSISVANEVTASVLHTASESAHETASSASSAASSILSQASNIASSLPSSSIVSAATEAGSYVVNSAAISASDALPAAISPVESFATTGPSLITSAVSAPTNEPVAEDDVDLDAFYAELGLDSVDSSTPEPAASPSATQYIPTPDELEERRLLKEKQTVQQRADITGRHTKWEHELESLIKAHKKTLRRKLVTLRKQGAAELKEHKVIREHIESLVTEAEKFLKGAESYLKNLKKDAKDDEEKIGMWSKVVDKVEEKFNGRLDETVKVVDSWYDNYHAKELKEVEQLWLEVHELARQAQADIGMDYSYLDDVTYEDWQRYHKLMDQSNEFKHAALGIQNGTHPSPPINPVLEIVDEFESEVQDVVLGFETRLRRIRRMGERTFSGTDSPADGDDDEKEEGISQETSKPEDVSILPVPSDDAQSPAISDIPQVIMGRSKEEVAQAFERFQEQKPPVAKSSDTRKVPERVVGSLAEDLPSEAVHHTEL